MSENLQSNPHPTETKILVDYFSFSVSFMQFSGYAARYDGDLFIDICERFHLDGLQFEERGGYHGYTKSFWYNGIIIAYDPPNYEGSQNTIHVNMSGSGCRTFETHNKGLEWAAWLRSLLETYSSFHCSRLDIACDTYGLLNVGTIQKYTRNGWYKSQWRTYLIQEGNGENSVVWGSSKSDFRMRIYDKTLERRRVVPDPDEVPEGWVRAEYQLRNDSAASFLREWLQRDDISAAYFGIMRNQLIYTKNYDGKNADRCGVPRWWSQFLGNYEKLKMAYPGGVEYNLQQLEKYLFHQAASSIKTYLKYTQGDLTPLLDGIQGAKINDRQWEMLKVETMQRQNRLIAAMKLREELNYLGQETTG